jgi:hypothetical protein
MSEESMKIKCTRKFTEEEAREIVWSDNPDYEVIEATIVDTTRWSTCHECVVREIKSGKLLQFFYRVGATEYQDERPFEHEGVVEAYMVEAYKKEITAYRQIIVEV